MTTWLQKLGLSRRARQAIHPPWRVGQYVTYFLDRDDGSWTALALQITGQSDDGNWSIEGAFKTPGGECTMLFRSDLDAPDDAADPVPVKRGGLRRFSSASDDVASMIADPLMAIPLAMNLMMVRRWPAAAECLSKAARPVQYPCGIDSAHVLITPGAGHEKHHDLSPRVLLTGVACLSIDSGKNPMTVTSFGLNDPSVASPSSYDDYVDLSHPKRIDHDGFVLTYPATWFLVREPDQEDSTLRIGSHRAHVGGVSCSLTCSVSIYKGDPRRVRKEYVTARDRMSGPLPGMTLREREPLRLPGEAWGVVLDYVQSGVDGVAYTAGCIDEGGERFALINAFGCIAKSSPRRHDTLVAYEHVLRDVVESFGFLAAGPAFTSRA